MHTHQSIWNNGEPTFAGDKYAGLSQTALWYIGGILKHAPALLAFTNPTTNSYKRLVPGFEAPVNLAYSQGNRSASVRIPLSGDNPKAKRLEFRCPDATSNPYLAFAAMLCAGIDGIKNQIDPGDPLDVDIYDLSPEELAKIPSTPGSLLDALKALEADHDFLTSWRGLHRRLHQQLDRVQARQRSQPHAPAAPPLRAGALLRLLRRSGPTVSVSPG
jgi:glutamine synthetase